MSIYCVAQVKLWDIYCVLSGSSHVRLCAMIVTRWAPLSMGISRQEYWSGLPFPSPGIFLTQGLNPNLLCLLHLKKGSLPLAPPGKPRSHIKLTLKNAFQYTLLLLLLSPVYIRCRQILFDSTYMSSLE